MSKKSTLLLLSLVMCFSIFAGFAFLRVEADSGTMYNGDGSVLVWSLDKNGISTQTPYDASGNKLNYFYESGMHNVGDDGTTFVQWGTKGSMIGNGFDVTKCVDIDFSAITSGWGTSAFVFSVYGSAYELVTGLGNVDTAKAVIKGSIKEGDAEFHKLTAGDQTSEVVDYDSSLARLRLYIGEEGETSYLALNGKKFAELALTRADFPEGKLYLAVTSLESHIQIKVQADKNVYDENGNALVWNADANGISAQTPYNSARERMSGSYESGLHNVGENGTTFVQWGWKNSMVGTGFDIKNEITLTFTLDPNKAWSQNGKGAFAFSLFDNVYDLIKSGATAGKSKGDFNGSIGEADANYHVFAYGEAKSEVYDYENSPATLTFYIAKEAKDSYVMFNGKQFASLNLSQSDFPNGKIYLSLTASYNTEIILKAEEKEKVIDRKLYNSDGTELVWELDRNGISTQIPYDKDGNLINKTYESGQHNEGIDGTTFLCWAGKASMIGAGFDVTKVTDLTFTLDPSRAWSVDGRRDRFTFSLFDNAYDLVAAGGNGALASFGSLCAVTGSINENDELYHIFRAGTSDSAVYDYESAPAKLSFYIGETEEESFIALNGIRFATLGLKQSDFKVGKIYISLIGGAQHTQIRMKAEQSDIEDLKVNLTLKSKTSGFSEINERVFAGVTLGERVAQNINGYSFVGWYTDETYLYKADFNAPIVKDTVYYARYDDLSKANRTVTFISEVGDYDDKTFVLDDGEILPDLGKIFYYEGFHCEWVTKDGKTFDTTLPVTDDMTLYAVWKEDDVKLYHKMNGVVDNTYIWSADTVADENGFDTELLSDVDHDTFVDENGNTVINYPYGCYNPEYTFKTYNDLTSFVLTRYASIMNLNRLDLRKEIVIRYALHNWDTTSDNQVSHGFVHFQLFDNVTSSLKASATQTNGMKAQISTSTYSEDSLFGKYTDGKVTSGDFGFENKKTVELRLFISEDGLGNYLKVDGTTVEGALAGVKRGDFRGGYAYLHIASDGSTHGYDMLVAQPFELKYKQAANGSYKSDAGETVLFKQFVTLMFTLDPGYTVKEVTVGNQKCYPNSDGVVTFYKGWGDEEVTVEYSKAYTATFETNGGTDIESQTVSEGEYFYKPYQPKKNGYKFIGWYTDKECTEEYGFRTPVSSDVTLYAKWESEKKDGGCKGNIGTSAMIALTVSAVFGLVIIPLKKRIK